MLIGVVGNRSGWNYGRVQCELMKNLSVNDTIISGGAIGVDTFAQKFAKFWGLKIVIIYPDTSLPSPRRFFERNQQIVDMSEKLIAFQKKPEKSGTQHTINLAKKKGIPVIVIRE